METVVTTVDLTDAEVLEYSKELAGNISKKRSHELDLKETTAGIKSEITKCESNINSLTHKISTGREQRAVPCDVKLDFEKNEKNWVSQVDGSIIRSTAIPAEELQQDVLETEPELPDGGGEYVNPELDEPEFEAPEGDPNAAAD